jgi:hypothetical protein
VANLQKCLIVAWGMALLLGAGCNKNEDPVRVSREPKEPGTAVAQTGDAAAPSQAADDITWTVPAGWDKRESQEAMRFATFGVSKESPDTMVTVVPLGMEPGSLVANVNRWEGQLGLPPSAEADLGKVSKPVTLGDGSKGTLVDISGGGKAMLAAIIPHAGKTWFIKLVGADNVVSGEKQRFQSFIESIRFGGGQAGVGQEPAAKAAPTVAPAGGGPFAYELPAGWEKAADRPMREASFNVSGGAEVIVSRLPKGAGSFEANVDRWRGQVGAPAGGAVEGKKLSVGGSEATQYDFVGDQKRQVVVIVNRGNDDWFFKIIGPKDVVEKEMRAFAKFLGTVKFSD